MTLKSACKHDGLNKILIIVYFIFYRSHVINDSRTWRIDMSSFRLHGWIDLKINVF
jgi:hypothetical protein